MSKTISALQQARAAYQPKLPPVLRNGIANTTIERGEPTGAANHEDQIKALMPNCFGQPIVTFKSSDTAATSAPITVGVVLSGGQAPGGHNVIAGLYDGLKSINADNKLFGYLGGPQGLLDDEYLDFNDEIIDAYRNTGGFDIIRSGRTKLESEEQYKQVLETAKRANLTAIVIIGGDDSNTNACVLADWFQAQGAGIQVIGVPKTIDGDLRNDLIEVSFGFDTAAKVYSELVGNIQRDADSAQKYWHFVKLMGRSASHIALEVGLQTQPNVCLISEEVAQKEFTLNQIVDQIVDVVVQRSKGGKDFGVVLVPEGLIEFIPAAKQLIAEVNDMLAEHAKYFETLKTNDARIQYVSTNLSKDSSYAFSSLPVHIQEQLLLDRDSHGNVQVSRIETESLLVELVDRRLTELKSEGTYAGNFSAICHFFGYEGRCAAPSNFDADYGYSLGYSASGLIGAGLTGYISCVRNMTKPSDEWIAGGVPLTMFMNMERRHGSDKPVIQKALVELDGKPFQALAANRDKWAVGDHYLYPGPIQYFGPSEVCDAPNKTIVLERG